MYCLRNSKDRRKQQQRWEERHVQYFFRKQYIKENDEGNGNVDRKHHIQQYGWDRHNEKHNSRQQI